jgi:hypothetical protein
LLQSGILALDRFHYGVTLPWPKWAAVVAILALQTYLMVGPSTGAGETGSASVQAVPVGVAVAQPVANRLPGR